MDCPVNLWILTCTTFSEVDIHVGTFLATPSQTKSRVPEVFNEPASVEGILEHLPFVS